MLEYPLSQARETRMNEAEFHKLAAVTLGRIEQAVETCGADIDFENAGEILQLEFANRSKIIINKQAAASQIWIAAKSGGFHYGYDASTQQQLALQIQIQVGDFVQEQRSPVRLLEHARVILDRPGVRAPPRPEKMRG